MAWSLPSPGGTGQALRTVVGVAVSKIRERTKTGLGSHAVLFVGMVFLDFETLSSPEEYDTANPAREPKGIPRRLTDPGGRMFSPTVGLVRGQPPMGPAGSSQRDSSQACCGEEAGEFHTLGHPSLLDTTKGTWYL